MSHEGRTLFFFSADESLQPTSSDEIQPFETSESELACIIALAFLFSTSAASIIIRLRENEYALFLICTKDFQPSSSHKNQHWIGATWYHVSLSAHYLPLEMRICWRSAHDLLHKQ
jgi:hypothetical protein